MLDSRRSSPVQPRAVGLLVHCSQQLPGCCLAHTQYRLEVSFPQHNLRQLSKPRYSGRGLAVEPL